jgi:cation:H+ antiporter
MSTPVAILLFATSLAATLAAAGLFARRLDTLGERLGIPEPTLGLLTALAADAPELSSAAAAMAGGHAAVGEGVVMGSNMFNLAAMIGLSAILAGSIRLDRTAVVPEGAVALAAVALGGSVLVGWLPAWLALAAVIVGAVPYLRWLSGLPPIPSGRPALAGRHRAALEVSRLFAMELPAVVVIVVGSVGMVDAAVTLADRWGASQRVVGLLVLATMTSLPNAATAIRLGLAGRASALVSETLNSNTINLTGGLIVPSLFVTVSASGGAGLDVGALVALTVVSLLLVGRRGGAGRLAGAGIIAGYVIWLAARLAM